MTRDDTRACQAAERQECLDAVLNSPARKKLVIGGPGTGKTFLFGQLLERNANGNNLAMTFIRRLVDDMAPELSEWAEVKTFHAFCKKTLHSRVGHVDLVPYLTEIISRDSELLEKGFGNFDCKIRMLEESSPEVAFYLKRGDYYGAVGFDDSVYRVLKHLRADPSILPSFDQIVIDEFQDFNPLEVAFIEELAKKGPILIVGDDDQAIYEGRSASAKHLRSVYMSGLFEVFDLPFCSRCPEVIINATHSIVSRAQARGYLHGRINKRYECFLGAKEADSIKYPRIVRAQCSTGRVIPKYIEKEILKIDDEDVADSYAEGKTYPTVLIVGHRQYLREVAKQLRGRYPHLLYSPSERTEYGINDAYEILLGDDSANLGWRILLELFCTPEQQKTVLARTEDGIGLLHLLAPEFLNRHLRVLKIIRAIRNGETLTPSSETGLREVVGRSFDQLIQHFAPKKEEAVPEVDETIPSILLTSFVGCKGLSGGHVFIIGANNGSIPKDPRHIRDIEISQFVVALTRTRKQCHIVSNKWLIAPVMNGERQRTYRESCFVTWVPRDMIENRGYLKANGLS